MSVDAIGNFLTIIRNGLMASKSSVEAPYSKMKLEIARILREEGFIRDYSVVEIDSVKKHIKVFLKYVGNESVIHEIKRISKPGRHCYTSLKTLSPVIGGLGLSILSTNKGVMSHKEAKFAQVGGKVICTVW